MLRENCSVNTVSTFRRLPAAGAAYAPPAASWPLSKATPPRPPGCCKIPWIATPIFPSELSPRATALCCANRGMASSRTKRALTSGHRCRLPSCPTRNIAMPNARLIHSTRLAGLALLVLALPARAGTIAADALPLSNRVATADMVIVGKVTSIEDKGVMVNKTEYKIAVVTISEGLVAPKGAKTVRLGFVPIPFGVAISPPPFQATVGQEGCFFLAKHGEADFFVAAGK